MPTGEELRQQAMTSVRSGDFSAARATLERARVATDEPDTLARITLSDAYIEAELEGAESGLTMCESVLATPGLGETTLGMAWSQLGLLQMRRGDRSAALRAFSEAIDRLDEDAELMGRVLLNRGTLHLDLRDPGAATKDLAAARARLAEAGLTETRAKAEHNLGYALLLQGDFVSALRLMDSAAAALSPMNDVMRSWSEQDRAEVLLAAGRTREAITSLQAAASAFGAQRLRRFQAEAELVLARTLLLTDPERARLAAKTAGTRFRRLDSSAWADRAEALAVEAGILSGSSAAQLRRRGDELKARLRRQGHHRDAEELALQIARLSTRRGELEDATARLRRQPVARAAPIAAQLLHREVRAELARARGHHGRALAHVRSGLDQLHDWQSSFGSLDLQSTLVGHGNSLARMGLELALADGSPALVLEWSERARSLASRITRLRPPSDPQLAADLTELRMLDPSDPRRVELHQRISRQSWYAGPAGAVRELVTLPDLQSTLAETDAALVAHIVLDEQVTALVVTSTGTRILPLGPVAPVRALLDRITADLDLAAAHRSGPLAEAVRAGLRTDLAEVAEKILAPLLPIIGERRLVLTPSARLAGTPWSLLPGLVGRPVTVPPSATRWRHLVGQSRGLARVGLVAGPGVPRAAEEVKRAGQAWTKTRTLLGDDAVSTAAFDLAGEVDLLHLAGHGRHAADNPLFSSVELTDGSWFGHDVDRLDTVPALVVLSACELGRSSLRSAEESVGMTAAWLHAGAHTVLSSPVLVADDVACDVLAAWHARVAAGVPPADALAEVARETDDLVPFLCFGAGW